MKTFLDLVAVFTGPPGHGFSNWRVMYRPHIIMTNFIIPAILPESVPPKNIKLDPIVFKQYVGEYYFKKRDITRSVISEADKLYYIAFDEEKVELSPLSEHQFRGTHKFFGEMKINFRKNQKGEVTKLERNVGFEPEVNQHHSLILTIILVEKCCAMSRRIVSVMRALT